ncbi:MAG: ribonuclease HI family protein [Planctomycetes bacterium]|nr:ribonuclease HI family protein [Planctomycetota bacterium]
MSDTATMHIDGASRGNPGPASYAVVLARPGLPVVEEADVIGKATNNVAEYTALVQGLELAAELGVKKLSVFSDSELMVKQMNGEYKVKHPDMLPLYQEAKQLLVAFEKFTITHVRREQNKRADEIGNDALDGRPRKRGQPYSPSPLAGEGSSRSERVRGEASTSQQALPLTRLEDSPPSPARGEGKTVQVGDASVRDDAIAILLSAAQAWSAKGLGAVPVEAVWEQLWSVLEDGNVLKKKKAK